jgi:hypothetical protein
MATKTNTIARAVIALTGRGHAVFNDRLADGRRSLKVWGWTEQDYHEAHALLTRAGCRATVVQFLSNGYNINGQYRKILRTRLHVAE